MIELGSKVKDSVTGFEGIATVRIEIFKGTTQFIVQGTELHEGRIVEERFEEGRLASAAEAERQGRLSSPVSHQGQGSPLVTVLDADMTDDFYASWQGENPLALRFARDAVQRYVRQQRITAAECSEKRSAGRLETTIEHAPECSCFDCTGIQPLPVAPEPLDPLEYYRVIIEQGGGIITLPDHLGVLVGPDPQGTPAGWLFVEIEGLTAEVLRSWVGEVRAGRAAWPGNARLELGRSKPGARLC